MPHFHVVFTLPEDLRPIALGNPRALHTLLFSVAAKTLTIIGRDPKHLGAQLGFFGILHTWGQTLDYHPHVHFVVPGGGIALDGSSWVPSRPRFLVSQRVLAALYRRLFVDGIAKLKDDGDIQLPPKLREPRQWQRLLNRLRKKKWVVDLREPFSTPERVIKYLARYTHRVAIADGRLRSVDTDGVSFDYKNYRTGQRQTMRLAGTEFVRRFALHVLPKRFVRVRYYGFLAHRGRSANIARCRALIEAGEHAVTEPPPAVVAVVNTPETTEASEDLVQRCDKCKAPMIVVRRLDRGERYWLRDTSTRAPPAVA